MDKPPSTGKTVAAASGMTGSAIIVLMWACSVLSLPMTAEVATAIITLATGLAGLIMHTVQRRDEAQAVKPQAQP